MALLGRDDERAELQRMLAGLWESSSAVLVVRGEAGVGKTALLDDTVSAADGIRVLRLTGIESEMELGFAALHALLLPFLGRLETLPTPQRAALRSAFGLGYEEPPERFLVGLATLTLLSDAGNEEPLLCVIDDAQWLDQESLAVFAFVARRLEADRVAMVLAVRDPSDRIVPLEGLPTLQLWGLDRTAAGALLDTVVGGNLDQRIGALLFDETRGNPMALLELGRDLTPEQLAGRSTLPDPLPLGRQLEAKFVRQVRALPASTQTFLLVAAAEPTGEPRLVYGAAERLGLPADAGSAAEAAGLLVVRPVVAFRHPLIRSAVYHSASGSDRRRVHDALASVSDADRDGDRRAWHRSASVIGVDEEIAEELEEAAERARRRGGFTGAAAFLTRAAQLTPDSQRRATRLLAAAQADFTAGVPARAQLLVDEAVPQLVDPLLRAHALRLQGAIRYALGDGAGTVSILLDAAGALAPLDPHLARETLLDAYSAAIYSARFSRGGGALQVAEAARALTLPPGSEATVGDLLLDGLVVLAAEGHAPAAPHLRRALEAASALTDTSDETLRWLGFGCLIAGVLGDNTAERTLAERLVHLARESGAQVVLTRGLYFLAMTEIVAGALATAGDHFAEGRTVMAARGDPTSAGEVVSNAWRGREDAARADFASVDRVAVERGQAGAVHAVAQYAVGVLELSLGNYDAALVRSRAALEEDSFFYVLSGQILPDLVEAAARAGDRNAGEAALAQLADRASVNGTHLELGLLARSQALMVHDSDTDAEALYRAAIDHLGRADALGQLGRGHLVLGEWLRRQRRRRDAREHLRAALQLFDTIGADGFAARARAELLATGETARQRVDETRNELTPQEERIARLAARGSTNSEIAAQLFISVNTVDYHLRKVYRKLDVSSRRQLAGTTLVHD
jgi:DNA-binding CsgD family transcriptional regulator/uncharacterized protein YjeT (DUF2065 family)